MAKELKKVVFKGVVTAVMALGMLAMAVPVFAQGEEAQVRVAHLSPDAPRVDVYLDGEPVEGLSGVPFTTVSSYFPVQAGSHNVEIFAAGDDSEPVVQADLDLRGGTSYTVGAVGLAQDGSLKAQVYEDNVSLPERGDTKLRAIHAAPDVQAVDIAPEDGEDLFVDLGFPNASSYAEVPAGTYTLEAELSESGEDAFVVSDAPLSGGTVYSAFAVGEAERGELEVVLVGDKGVKGGQQITAPASPMPETGGPSLMLLASSGIALIGLAGFCAAYLKRTPAAARNNRTTDGRGG